MPQESHFEGMRSIRVEGEKRSYLLYVPASYDESRPTPLLLSFHGFSDWPARHRTMTGENDLAEEQGLIVVYPKGTGFPLRWTIDTAVSNHVSPAHEVTFITLLIERLAEQYHLDLRRVYANGFSNGGGMTVLLASRLSDRIAAAGVVAAAIRQKPEECGVPRPVPLIAFHGTTDPIVPYEGGSNVPYHGVFPSIPEWMRGLAAHYGCDPEPERLPDEGEVSGVRYRGCDLAEVALYTVNGGGHAWPGGKPLPGAMVGHTTQDVNATRMMWDFFSRFTLPEDLPASS